MREAVILHDGRVAYLDEISLMSTYDPNDNSIHFHPRTGRVFKFKKNGDYYIPIGNEDSNFIGYYPERLFWEKYEMSESGRNIIHDENYQSKIVTINEDDITDFFDMDLYVIGTHDQSDVEIGTKVILINKKIEFDAQGTATSIKVQKKSYSFDNQQLSSVDTFESPSYASDITYTDEGIIKTSNITNLDIKHYLKNISEKKYKNASGDMYFYKSHESIIIDIIHIFHELSENLGLVTYLQNEQLIDLFDEHFAIVNDTTFTKIPESGYYNYFTEGYFSMLRLRLIEFKQWADGINFEGIDTHLGFTITTVSRIEVIVRLVSLFNKFEISRLTYSDKKDLLFDLLDNGSWINGTLAKKNEVQRGGWLYWKVGPPVFLLSEEEAMVKIIDSIIKLNPITAIPTNFNEVDDFMELLQKPHPNDTDKMLFEVLYDNITDAVLFGDDGNGARGQLIKVLYNLWQESKFNPNHLDSNKGDVATDYFTYTPYDANWQFEDSSEPNPEIDDTAAPMLLNYESEKYWLWYNDNYNFEFENFKVVSYEEVNRSAFLTAFSVRYPVLKFFNYKYIKRGTYDVLQPISLSITKHSQTVIKMPFKKVDGVEVTETNMNEFIHNCFPIFYLKYVDDLGDYSDIKELIGTGVDVALTFSGIGNITKLRHFTKLSLIRKLFINGGLTAVEKIALKKAMGAATIGAVEATLAIASLVHNFATGGCSIYVNDDTPPQPGEPDYDDYHFCQRIQFWLNLLEIVALSGDIYARRALQRSGNDLKNSIDPNTTDTDKANLRNLLNGLDELDELLEAYKIYLQNNYPAIKTVFDTFHKDKKFAFMFNNNIGSSNLNDINANASQFMTNWSDLYDIKSIDNHVISVITNQNRVNDLKKYFAHSHLKIALENIPFEKRMKILDHDSMRNMSTTLFNKLSAEENGIHLLIETFENVGKSDAFLKFEDAIDVVEHLNKHHIGVHRIVNKITDGSKLHEKYLDQIENIPLTNQQLKNIYDPVLLIFKDPLPNGKGKYRKWFKSMNLLFTKKTIVQGTNTPIVEFVDYMSDHPNATNNILQILKPGNGYHFAQVSDPTKFNIFKRNALELSSGDPRLNDTEIKAIFDILENDFHRGDVFSIEFTSILYTCPSCQRFPDRYETIFSKSRQNTVYYI